MKQYKSPGLDGIINEFDQIYWDTIKEDLFEVLLEIFVPITHLKHGFIQCCASFPLLRWEYLNAMAAAIKNIDSAVT